MSQQLKVVAIKDLKPGMRFSFIPAAWHGPSVVREVRPSGSLVCVRFDNPLLVNPPDRSTGSFYSNPGHQVMVLRRKT